MNMNVRAAASLILFLSPACAFAEMPVSPLDSIQGSALEKVADFQSNQKATRDSAVAVAYDHLLDLRTQKLAKQREIAAQQAELNRWMNDFRERVASFLSSFLSEDPKVSYVMVPDPAQMTDPQIQQAIYSRRIVLPPSDNVECSSLDDRRCVFLAKPKKSQEYETGYFDEDESKIYENYSKLLSLTQDMQDIDSLIQSTQADIDRLSKQ